ncbi:MAG: (deoxy)nucleoside triphosphate pyrophosphohydrolase [Candidatus Undinarchaeales archaeon]|jgi:8-oxo-dGTP diphosphatase|nr:(deoxy)nucleoside triphosphate pyrophosphohydrolase [Candidatus Undinarchaeales archaeon]MDP7494719.1 (deoxy)nucleoside triphosphate pyrophosphohydrolase [Candidatus Undinarchaeales archaeon]
MGKGHVVKVTAAVIERDGRFLIAQRRPDDGSLGGLWEFPGGTVEAGETPEDCLRRELAEELAIDVQVEELINRNTHSYPHMTIELLAFRVTWLEGEMELREHTAARWVVPDELGLFPMPPADGPLVHVLVDGRHGPEHKSTVK